MSKIEKKIQSKCTLSWALTWPVAGSTSTCSRLHAWWGRSAQASQFCIRREFLSSNPRKSANNVLSFLEKFVLVSHEKAAVIVPYILAFTFSPLFLQNVLISSVIWMKILLKVFATGFQVFSSFWRMNSSVEKNHPKTVKLRRCLISWILFSISLGVFI